MFLNLEYTCLLSGKYNNFTFRIKTSSRNPMTWQQHKRVRWFIACFGDL